MAVLSFPDLRGQVIVDQSDSIYASLPATPDGIHIRFRKDHWDRMDLKTGEITKHHIPDIGLLTRHYQPILLQQGLFLVHELGGMVFQVEGDSVFRIDRSFDHRMQNNSIIFQRKDTILRHGGYGFWSSRQLIVYFDPRSGNWEPYPYKPGGAVPPGLSQHQFILNGDSLLVFGGVIADPSDPLVPRLNDQVWLFNFRSREWTKLGDVTWKELGYTYMQIPVIPLSKNFFLVSRVEALAVAPLQNSVSRLKLSERLRYWIAIAHTFPFLWNDRFYYYRNTPDAKKSTELCYLPAVELTETAYEKQRWINNSDDLPLWLYYTICILLLLGVAYFFLRSRLVVKFKNNSSQLKSLDLDSSEVRLLNAFISHYPGSLMVAEIDTALETSRKSRDVQNQRRSQVIRSVNTKFMVYAQTDSPVILSKRSESDGRMVEYYIDPEWYEVLVKGLGRKIE